VGVHLQRFLPYLDRAGVDYVLYNIGGPTEIPGRVLSVAKRSRWWFFRFLFFGREPVIYLTTAQWVAWAATWFLTRTRGKRVIIVLQGENIRSVWDSHGPLVRRWIRRGLESAACIITANTHIRDFLERIGGLCPWTAVVPAFIPPVWRAEDEAVIAEEVRKFCREHHPLIMAVGAPVIWKNTLDLYGIDMTIELVDRLRKDYPNIGVFWSLLNFIGSRPEYADRLRQEVERRGLEGHWCFSDPQPVFYPCYTFADLFVRPTCTDGDALSIREAMHFGVPVVTSDAVPRPDGAILFRSRDIDDFEQVVRNTLDHLTAERERLRQQPTETAAEKELAIIQEVIAQAAAET
jgi:glycosyltransferase involved in cell wall biosynthesis